MSETYTLVNDIGDLIELSVIETILEGLLVSAQLLWIRILTLVFPHCLKKHLQTNSGLSFTSRSTDVRVL